MTGGTVTLALRSKSDAVLATETSRVPASRLRKKRSMFLCILDDKSGNSTCKLPASAVRLLLCMLDEMARGNPVTLVPVHAELTAQEAADLMNILRRSFIQLLDK